MQENLLHNVYNILLLILGLSIVGWEEGLSEGSVSDNRDGDTRAAAK